MKKIAQIFSIVLLIAMLFCFCSCNITITDKRTETEKVDENKDDGKSLKLLSFETLKEQEELKLPEDEQVMLLAETITESESALENLPENFEATSDTHQHVRATIRNVERDSFIDLVLYFSWLNTQVVYNEGNGEYQCKSTTKFDNENQVWVTVIDLELDVEFDEEFTAMVEVKEINFLHNGDQKVHAELNSTAVRTIEYCMVFMADEAKTIEYENMKFELLPNNEAKLVKVTEFTSEVIDIPDHIHYSDYLGEHAANVTEIGPEPFLGDSEIIIKEVHIPPTVKVIESGFRSDRLSITKISLCNTVNRIGANFLQAGVDAPEVEIKFYGSEEEWNILLQNSSTLMIQDFDNYSVIFVPTNNNEE